ncbi:MAG: hypothetical protein PUD55_07210 [Firmicutes bacterium]|nr:hypothetical protein [Bacillota bacterium]
MSFTSETEEEMSLRGYELTVSDGVNVFWQKDGLIFDEDVTVNYSIQPWMSKCETKGICVDKEYARRIAASRGDQAE